MLRPKWVQIQKGNVCQLPVQGKSGLKLLELFAKLIYLYKMFKDIPALPYVCLVIGRIFKDSAAELSTS